MKLIIDIPKDYYELMKHEVEHHITDYRPFVIIANGIPLDDVKAEIRKHCEFHYMDGDIIADELLSMIDKHMRGDNNG